jgi:hypothetical protein
MVLWKFLCLSAYSVVPFVSLSLPRSLSLYIYMCVCVYIYTYTHTHITLAQSLVTYQRLYDLDSWDVEIRIFLEVSISTLLFTMSPSHSVALSPRLRRPEREADYLPVCNTKVRDKN